ncbi:MAG: hypothetical protein A2413_12530 [Treponema sp. RIFOXYC1_FULL_61_9]|nr:MAG: hypothetical protein A2Y36_06285 [Treponema sp. GWA1_62_8]OHE68568.1 MAG: hypothetical protein A2413_12530 [Treponema sp. RIFOXYC1_FULL_61_9]
METKEKPYACSICATSAWLRGDFDRMPKACPTRTHPEISRDPRPYGEEALDAQMKDADATPYTSGGVLRNRMEELIAYAKSQDLRRIGIAFCVSLTKEAQRLGGLLNARSVNIWRRSGSEAGMRRPGQDPGRQGSRIRPPFRFGVALMDIECLTTIYMLFNIY